MEMQAILAKKRRGLSLTTQEVEFFVKKVSSNEAHEAQIGALLMAIAIHGMSQQETTDLTSAMVKSGKQMEWSGLVADKHSTGGVGDKVSIPLAPILAELGLTVPMISGRSLEFTGGTLDKLESIPGFNVNLSAEDMERCLKNCGCFIAAATQEICPADKKIYSIRDVTSTVDCEPLVVASILSKKKAEGAKFLVQDIKVGEAAFFKDTKSAESLAKSMIRTADIFDLKMAASLTRMDHPIGRAVGNSLEIQECIDVLKGEHFPPDLMELILELGATLLVMTGISDSPEIAKDNMLASIKSGKALKRFYNMLINQGVSEDTANKVCFGTKGSLLPKANFTTEFKAPEKGYIENINALTVAKICFHLGSGRTIPSDKIDLAVGCELLVSQGERIDSGQCWAVLHHNAPITQKIKSEMDAALKISSKATANKGLLIKTYYAKDC